MTTFILPLKNNDFDDAHLSSPVDSSANIDVHSCGSKSISVRAGDVSRIRDWVTATGRL